MASLISVVIVNYNGAKFLAPCLSSVTAQTYAPFELLLVDNASTDDSRRLVEREFPWTKLICSKENVGFAAGNNLGLAAAGGEWIATLNTDTRVEPDYLEQLYAATGESDVGACAPLMTEMEHPEIVDAAGIRVDDFGYAWNIGAGKSAGEFAAPGFVYGACAGAALYRRAMLDEIGFFDDAFFGFYEDADLAWRARKKRWKTIFVPSARVYHTHGASFGKISRRKTYLLARNRWWTSLKNYPMPQFALALPLLLMLDLASFARATGRGHLREAWQGRLDAWHTRKIMWAKRETR